MINKCFEFKDYNHKRSEPNYTTVADFYRYCDNQNNVLKSLADCLLWQPSTDYTVGQIVRAPGMPAGHIAKCTTAGKSSEEEPAWTDDAVPDGTAKWSVYDPESATDDKITTASSKKLDKIGGAITGPISYDGTPKTDIELVNKSYVLTAIKSARKSGGGVLPGVILAFSGEFDSNGYPIDTTTGTANTTWHLCDGTNGTPDLRGRFILGASASHAVGTTGGEEATGLEIENLPPHNFTGTTDKAGLHSHRISAGAAWNSGSGFSIAYRNNSNMQDFNTVEEGLHAHTFTTNTLGSGVKHNNMPPYYTLSYIMFIG